MVNNWNGIKLCSTVWIVKKWWNGMVSNGIYSIAFHHLLQYFFPSNLGGIGWNHLSFVSYKLWNYSLIPILLLFFCSFSVGCCSQDSSSWRCWTWMFYPRIYSFYVHRHEVQGICLVTSLYDIMVSTIIRNIIEPSLLMTLYLWVGSGSNLFTFIIKQVKLFFDWWTIIYKILCFLFDVILMYSK